jgi:hypothetical protein
MQQDAGGGIGDECAGVCLVCFFRQQAERRTRIAGFADGLSAACCQGMQRYCDRYSGGGRRRRQQKQHASQQPRAFLKWF